ncbi:conserved hypothetical protein [Ricinus communis]|uniref:Uncharacterized protein n=1 Tax=Ricinus communis TaxID=3988 RepID=B9TBZ2_RICCO|nr:conserved hypothetical protein [Ricinus communis]
MSQSKGFLSDMLTSIASIRRDFAPWFDAASAFNDLGMLMLPVAKADQSDNQQLVAATLYGRTLTSYQAAYLLTERGMLADARTIVRAAAETAICLCAVVEKPSVIDLLIQRHFFHHRRLRTSWLHEPQARAALTDADIQALKAGIEQIDSECPDIAKMKRDPVSIADLARDAGVTALYNVVYRSASGDAAHTSPDALNRHVKADMQGNIHGLKFGPETDDLPATLSDAISVLAHALHAVRQLFQLHRFDDDLRACEASWSALGVPAEYRPSVP